MANLTDDDSGSLDRFSSAVLHQPSHATVNLHHHIISAIAIVE